MPRRWTAAGLLVLAGFLASPHAVPVYDGVGQPDEPYRYVSAPSGAPRTAAPTTAVATSPVAGGASTNGLSLTSGEVGPQLSAFVPAGALAASGGTVTVRATPLAATDQPKGARIDGNVYDVTVTDPVGPVTLTPKAALATLYLRATSARQPGPVMEHRAAAGQPWAALQTSRGGQDVYIAAFAGAGQYALAFRSGAVATKASVLPWVLAGGVLVLLVALVAVRLRAGSTSDE